MICDIIYKENIQLISNIESFFHKLLTEIFVKFGRCYDIGNLIAVNDKWISSNIYSKLPQFMQNLFQLENCSWCNYIDNILLL